MEKLITELTLPPDPFTISLADRKCSLFIDPESGVIYLDEGSGEDRVNGAVLSPNRQPRFVVVPTSGDQHSLALSYSGMQLIVGIHANMSSLSEWVSHANSFLIEKGMHPSTTAPLSSMDTTNPVVDPALRSD